MTFIEKRYFMSFEIKPKPYNKISRSALLPSYKKQETVALLRANFHLMTLSYFYVILYKITQNQRNVVSSLLH